MCIIVSKFGGSSTANADMFFRIKNIISTHTSRRYIILSAPGKDGKSGDKITNLLYRCYDLYIEGKDFSLPLEEICRRFSQLSQALSLPDAGDAVKKEILESITVSRDHTASRGEYLCALIFSRWMGLPMVDASDIIHFSSSGSLDTQKTFSAINNMKNKYTRAIIPGFYGAMPDGRIHTFPRNGSDITGALVSAGVQAVLYENWSDVDGFMTADPALTENAVFNPNLSYSQMYALAREGAQLLHPDCLAPVYEKGIPTLLKNTSNPDGPGTLISSEFNGSVPCVTGQQDCLLIPLDDPRASQLPEGISFRCVADLSGREYIFAKLSDISFGGKSAINVSCICVFGLSKCKEDILLESVPHICALHEGDCFRLVVNPGAYISSVQVAHDILTKDI